MSEIITETYKDLFNESVITPFQQKTARLDGRVNVHVQDGERERHIIPESRAGKKKQYRHEKTNPEEHKYSHVWTTLGRYSDTALFDEDDDKYSQLTNPMSTSVNTMAMALARQSTGEFIDAILGPRQTGKDGYTSEAFDTSNYLIADGSTGLVYDKLLAARSKFGQFEADGMYDGQDSGITMFLTQTQMDNMIEDAKIGNADTSLRGASIGTSGWVDFYMGISFIRVAADLLPKVGNIRQCVAFHKDAVIKAIGSEGITTRAAVLESNSFSELIRSSFRQGSCRLLNEGVIRVDCDES